MVRELLAKARKGTRVVYIAGNHDEILRRFAGTRFGPISIALEVVHQTADGRHLLVLHGDEFENLLSQNPVLNYLGGGGYELLQLLNRHFNYLRGKLGYPYWSLSCYVKAKLRNAARYMDHFTTAAVRTGSQYAVDGLICGHIHMPTTKCIDGVLYYNTGDWVENCTALVEYANGHLLLIDWLEQCDSPRETLLLDSA